MRGAEFYRVWIRPMSYEGVGLGYYNWFWDYEDAIELFRDIREGNHAQSADAALELVTVDRDSIWINPGNDLERMELDLSHAEVVSGKVLERWCNPAAVSCEVHEIAVKDQTVHPKYNWLGPTGA